MNPMPTLETSASFKAVQGRSAIEVGELLESYRANLRRQAASQLHGRLSQRISPSDVVQETMLAAHRDIDGFRGRSSHEFAAWLRRILSNKLLGIVDRHLNLKRDARREVSIHASRGAADSSELSIANLIAAKDPSVSAVVSRTEDYQRVATLMERLPPDYKTVIELRNVRGLRFNQIAEHFQRTPQATRLLWLRAIHRLRELADQEPSSK